MNRIDMKKLLDICKGRMTKDLFIQIKEDEE